MSIAGLISRLKVSNQLAYCFYYCFLLLDHRYCQKKIWLTTPKRSDYHKLLFLQSKNLQRYFCLIREAYYIRFIVYLSRDMFTHDVNLYCRILDITFSTSSNWCKALKCFSIKNFGQPGNLKIDDFIIQFDYIIMMII